jgi:hypothetical protein
MIRTSMQSHVARHDPTVAAPEKKCAGDIELPATN